MYLFARNKLKKKIYRTRYICYLQSDVPISRNVWKSFRTRHVDLVSLVFYFLSEMIQLKKIVEKVHSCYHCEYKMQSWYVAGLCNLNRE